MNYPEKKTLDFHYNAHGHGLSAQFQRPFDHVIEVQAGMSLPISGGHGSSRVENFQFKEFISFKSAYCHVSGSQNKEDGSFTTLVSSTVEKLNILDVVTADRIVSRISCRHVPGEAEPHIIPLGSKFEDLRIASCPVHLDLDLELFCEYDTFTAFKEKFGKDPKFRKTVQDRFLWGELDKDTPEFVRTRYNWAKRDTFPESRGAVLCSLIKDVVTSCPGLERYGQVIVVPQFGRIFLGEFLIERYARRLTMLRLELGSPVQGVITVASGQGNGSPWRP
jgi:hypothetical protein